MVLMYDAHFHQDKMYDMNMPVLCAEKKHSGCTAPLVWELLLLPILRN